MKGNGCEDKCVVYVPSKWITESSLHKGVQNANYRLHFTHKETEVQRGHVLSKDKKMFFLNFLWLELVYQIS